MSNLVGATTAVFPVRLSVASNEIVNVEWTTSDGTALSGLDYKAAKGVVKFLPGETEKQIQALVYGQPIVPAADKVFYIRLSPPSNAILVDSLLTCKIVVDDLVDPPATSIIVAEGRRGPKGETGRSAYEQAVYMGLFTGTVEQWMQQIADASSAADRAENAAVAANIGSKVYATPQAGVNINTGVPAGDYFNVRSLSSNHYVDEYQNVAGVATATGKSYPNIGWVERNAAIAEAAAISATISSGIYQTPSAGVAPVTGVPVGDYFNVRSVNSEHYVDEYQNVAGVATATGKSYPSSLAVDLTKQQILDVSDRVGNTWRNKVDGYGLNDRVMLENGDIVKSTEPNNTNDPNVDMTGWVKTNNASQIFDQNGLSQQVINSLSLTPFHFGAVGDSTSHKLSERYSTLIAAQVVYPHATALTDEIDWCALYAFLDFCEHNFVQNANWSINAFVNKELYYGTKTSSNPASKVISGTLQLQSTSNSKHFIQIVGNNLRMGSVIDSSTQTSIMTSRTIEYGVVIGSYINENFTCQNSTFETIISERVLKFGLVVGKNAHFSMINHYRGAACGSGCVSNSTHSHQANFSNRVDTWGDVGQNTKITVSSMPPDLSETAERCYVLINNEPYQIVAKDMINSTISLYPCLDKNLTSGTLDYSYGGAYTVISNNTAQTTIVNFEAILCGKSYDARALYGTRFVTYTTEYCGIAALIGDRSEAHIGSSASSGYFEANRIDILTGWGLSHFKSFSVKNNIGLDLAKVRSMFSYRIEATNKLREDWKFVTCLDLDIDRKNYSGEYDASGSDVTDPICVKTIYADTINHTVGVDQNISSLFLKSSFSLIFIGNGTNGNPSGMVTLTAATGSTINDGASFSIDGLAYDSPITVSVIHKENGALIAKVSGVLKSRIAKGITAQRPSSPILGQRYYDTTLLAAGKPIEWNGVNWVDSAGTTV